MKKHIVCFMVYLVVFAESASTQTSTNFNYVYTYRKPDNVAEALQEIMNYLYREGGAISGDGKEGLFVTRTTEGIYQVTGDTVTVSFRHAIHNLPVPFSTEPDTSRGSEFTIDKPKDMSLAVRSFRSGIAEKGGTFTGDEQQGNFRASGITGSYNVTDRVNINITEKPVLIPLSLIKKMLEEWLKGL